MVKRLQIEFLPQHPLLQETGIANKETDFFR